MSEQAVRVSEVERACESSSMEKANEGAVRVTKQAERANGPVLASRFLAVPTTVHALRSAYATATATGGRETDVERENLITRFRSRFRPRSILRHVNLKSNDW